MFPPVGFMLFGKGYCSKGGRSTNLHDPVALQLTYLRNLHTAPIAWRRALRELLLVPRHRKTYFKVISSFPLRLMRS
jgi:hypothetical protein